MTDDLDLYDPVVQQAISWTLDLIGKQLGADRWDGGDGSETVEGDVSAEVDNIMRAAGLVDAEGEPLRRETYAAPPPPADTAMREAIARIIDPAAFLFTADELGLKDYLHPARVANEKADVILATLSRRDAAGGAA